MSPHFRPEFLARLTEVVPFAPISVEVATQIFALQFKKLQQQLEKEKEINLLLSPNALAYLVQKGYSPKYGARPIAGVIRTYIKKAVSRLLVSQSAVAKDTVLLHFDNTDLVWEKVDPDNLPQYAKTLDLSQEIPSQLQQESQQEESNQEPSIAVVSELADEDSSQAVEQE